MGGGGGAGLFVIHNIKVKLRFLSYISLILNTYQEIIKLRWLFGSDLFGVCYRNSVKHSIILQCILFPQKP